LIGLDHKTKFVDPLYIEINLQSNPATAIVGGIDTLTRFGSIDMTFRI
jgi:hypothetical protein